MTAALVWAVQLSVEPVRLLGPDPLPTAYGPAHPDGVLLLKTVAQVDRQWDACDVARLI